METALDLHHPDLKAVNSKDAPDEVSPRTRSDVSLDGTVLQVLLVVLRGRCALDVSEMPSNRNPGRTLSHSSGRKALRIHGTIAQNLGIRIVSGDYAPGQILEGEIAASDQLRVSRTAYREAIRILAAKGLVESRPKTGTRVSSRKKWHLLDPDVLSWIFQHEPDEQLLANLFELRRIIEPEAAALAAKRRTEGHLRDMEQALAGMEQHTLAIEEGRFADQQFHSTLLDASGNAFLVSLTTGVESAVSWSTEFKQRKSPLRRDPLPDHRKVFEAVAAQDEKAAHAAMAELIDWAFIDTTTAGEPPPKVAAIQ